MEAKRIDSRTTTHRHQRIGAIEIVRLQGETIYQAVIDLQQQLFDENLRCKNLGLTTKNTLIVCEHCPVYTLGKAGKKEHLLFDPTQVGADFYTVQRGGDITFHGPGQLVIYPIFDLETLKIGVADFVYLLEEAVIKTIANYSLLGYRIKTASGVWLHTPSPLKICAVGLRVSRQCTMHGIALNVNTDLRFFNYIVPCGLANMGVTSMQRELGTAQNLAEVEKQFIENFLALL